MCILNCQRQVKSNMIVRIFIARDFTVKGVSYRFSFIIPAGKDTGNGFNNTNSSCRCLCSVCVDAVAEAFTKRQLEFYFCSLA